MKRFVKVKDGIVVNFTVQENIPSDDETGFWVETDNDAVSPQWKYENGAFTMPDELAAYYLTYDQFVSRFTSAELQAAENIAEIKGLLDSIDRNSKIHLRSNTIFSIVEKMLKTNLLSADRSNELIAVNAT